MTATMTDHELHKFIRDTVPNAVCYRNLASGNIVVDCEDGSHMLIVMPDGAAYQISEREAEAAA